MVTRVTSVHIDQIWSYVTFFGHPQIFADLSTPGHRWSHLVTYGHNGHLGLVLPGNRWSHVLHMVTIMLYLTFSEKINLHKNVTCRPDGDGDVDSGKKFEWLLTGH